MVPGAKSASADERQGTGVIALLTRLGRGEFGLSRTHWYGWVLSDIAWLIPAAIVALIAQFVGTVVAAPMVAVLAALYLAYNVLVMVGIWRAADAYQGWRGWAVWAKFNVGVVGVGLIGLASVLLLRLLLG